MSNDNPTADDVVIDEPTSESKGSQMEENLKSKSTWFRILFICIYAALVWLASLVGAFVVVLGFLWKLFTGEVNAQLRQAGQGIASYIYQAVRYMTFNTDTKPFPFGESWPPGTEEKSD